MMSDLMVMKIEFILASEAASSDEAIYANLEKRTNNFIKDKLITSITPFCDSNNGSLVVAVVYEE